MKTQIIQTISTLALIAGVNRAVAQGTAFTYQGQLSDNQAPANGLYDLNFSLFNAANGGPQVGGTITLVATGVTNGLFTVTLDFGAIFPGAPRWLQIGVRTNGVGSYVALSPRQEMTPTPYAIYSGNAAELSGQSASAYAPATGSTAYVAKAGDTMTGPLTVNGDLVADPNDQGNPANVSFTASSVDGTAMYCHSYGLPLHVHNDFGGQDVTLGGGNPAIFMGGNVGIGTTTPHSSLEIDNSSSDLSNQEFLRLGFGPSDYDSIAAFFNGNAGNSSLAFNVEYASGDIRQIMTLKGNAVGIGTTAPAAKLDVADPIQAYVRLVSENGPNGSILELRDNASYGPDLPPVELGAINFVDGNGNVPGQIAYEAKSDSMLIRAGTVSVSVLQINGADLAEPFDLSTKDIPKGSVVIIDEENPGELKLSEQAYDKRVAGILSGANGVHPGIRLKQEGFNDHGQEVALSGRVYVLADASYGSIKPGDSLTTSDTPGRCMKVTDPARAQGAIIGKAMSSLNSGKGMVLVLVSLQ